MNTDSHLISFPGLSVLQRILDTAAEHSWQVTSVNLDTLTEAAFIKLLTDLDYKKDFQIIIDCELERLNSILNLVKHSLIHMSINHMSLIRKHHSGHPLSCSIIMAKYTISHSVRVVSSYFCYFLLRRKQA